MTPAPTPIPGIFKVRAIVEMAGSRGYSGSEKGDLGAVVRAIHANGANAFEMEYSESGYANAGSFSIKLYHI